MVECPACHEANLDTAKYCSRCGFRLKTLALLSPQVEPGHWNARESLTPFPSVQVPPIHAVIQCPKCSSINSHTAGFCEVCGTNLTSFRSLSEGTIIGS